MSRCVACLPNVPHDPKEACAQCPNEGYFRVTSYQKKDEKWIRFNTDVFCEDHAYEFSMYYFNYLGLRIEIKLAEIEPSKVLFT